MDERKRREMYERLERALGEEAAEALMAHLPPLGWGEVATKAFVSDELDKLRTEFRGDLRGGLAELRVELAEFRGELRAEIHSVARKQLTAVTVIVTFVVGLLNGGLYLALRAS